MNHVIVAVFDEAAECYARPVVVSTRGLAVRSFRDEVNRADADNQVYRHPEHFRLYCLADFDDITGSVVGIEPPELLGLASQFKEE